MKFATLISLLAVDTVVSASLLQQNGFSKRQTIDYAAITAEATKRLDCIHNGNCCVATHANERV